MRKLIVCALLFAAAPSAAWSSPMLNWDSNDKGYWITAYNSEDRTYNCSVRYTLTINGQSETREQSFVVQPKTNGLVAFVRSVILPPNTPWSVVQEDSPRCY